MKFLIVIWTVFTATLAVWWWILGLRLVQMQESLPGVNHAVLESMHRMFMAEGSVLVLLIIAGGAALGASVWKIRQQNQALREFFASFTHEVKTSLTNLRLQTELMQEEDGGAGNLALQRLLQESQRLELQFENSLQLAQGDSSRVFLEDVDLRHFLASLAEHWPTLKVKIDMHGRSHLRADRRALEIIFRNIFQNALMHGEAQNVQISGKELEGWLEVRISNDGKIFRGDRRQLGKMFLRQEGSSGTGIGLALVQRLMSRLGGRTAFDVTDQSRLEIGLFFPRGASL